MRCQPASQDMWLAEKTPYTSGHVGVSSVLMTLAAWWKVWQEQ
jgi:hypothetical protein